MGMRQVVELGWAPRPLREDVEALVSATWRSARFHAGLTWEDAAQRFSGMFSVLEFVGSRELAADMLLLGDVAAAIARDEKLAELRSSEIPAFLPQRWAA